MSVRPLARNRAARIWPSLRSVRLSPGAVLADLSQSSRWIRRHPSTSLVVFVTMSVALAAALAAFRVINATILRPLPFPTPDHVVNVRVTGPTLSRDVRSSSRPDFEDWRERTRSFAELSAHAPVTFRLTGRGEPREIEAARVAPGFDRVLGRAPLLGRLFERHDYAGPDARVVVPPRLRVGRQGWTQ